MRILVLLCFIFSPLASQAQTVSVEKIIEFLLVKRGVPYSQNDALKKLTEDLLRDSTLKDLIQQEDSELVTEFNAYREDRAANVLQTQAEKYVQAILTHEAESVTAQTTMRATQLVSLNEALKRSAAGGFADQAFSDRFNQLTIEQVRKDFISRPETFIGENAPFLRSYLGASPLGNDLTIETWLRLYRFSHENPYLTEALTQVRKLWMSDPSGHADKLSKMVHEGAFALGENDGDEFLRSLYSKVSGFNAITQRKFLEATKSLPLEEKITAEIAFRKKDALPESLSRASLYQANYIHPQSGISDSLNRDLKDYIILKLSDPHEIASVEPFQFRFLQKIDPSTATRFQRDYLKKVFIPRLQASGVDFSRNDEVNRGIVETIFRSDDSAAKNQLINLEISGTPPGSRAYDGIRNLVRQELVNRPNSRWLIANGLLNAERVAISSGPTNTTAAFRLLDSYQNALSEFAQVETSKALIAEAMETHAEFFSSLIPLFKNGLPNDASEFVNQFASFLTFAERTSIQKDLKFRQMLELVTQFKQTITAEIPGAFNCLLHMDGNPIEYFPN